MLTDVDENEVIDLPEAGDSDEIEALLLTIDDLEEDVGELRDECDRLKGDADNAKDEAARAQSELQAKTAECKQLSAELAEALVREKRALVDRLVDLKVQAGKASKDERDRLVSQYMERTIESVRDLLSDCVDEARRVQVPPDPPQFEALVRSGETHVVNIGDVPVRRKPSLEEMLTDLIIPWRRKR